MKLIIFILTGVLSINFTMAQIGLNEPNPNKNAAIDVKSFSKGIKIPNLSTTNRLNINDPKPGLLVFDEDFGQYYVYQNQTLGWLAINPFFTNGDTTSTVYSLTQGNVGINVKNPANKLSVGMGVNVGQSYAESIAVNKNSLITERKMGINTNNPQSELHVNGSVACDTFSIDGKGDEYFVKPNTIVMYYSSSAPSGWAVCDGRTVYDSKGNSFKTPDFRNLIPKSSSSSTSSSGSGVASFTLDEDEIPNHTHDASFADHTHKIPSSSSGAPKAGDIDGVLLNPLYSGSKTKTAPKQKIYNRNDKTGDACGNSSGSADAINTLPPVTALTFIIKLP